MAEEITNEEINSMIETCINAVNEGKYLTSTQKNRFATMLKKIGRPKGIIYPIYADFKPFFSPQGILMVASDLKLITKPEHQKFLAQRKILIEIEGNLLSLVHIFPEKFRQFIFEQTSRPIEARWGKLSKLSGLSFSKLLALTKKADALSDRITFKRGLGRKEKQQERLNQLQEEFFKLHKQIDLESAKFVSAIKGRLAIEFAKPDYGERLLGALKGAGDDARKREKEILQKYLEAWNKRTVRQKPIQRRIQYK